MDPQPPAPQTPQPAPQPQPDPPLAPRSDEPMPHSIPNDQPQPRGGRRIGTTLMVAGALLAVVALGLAYILFVMPKLPSTSTTPQTGENDAASLSALKRTEANTARREDTTKIMAAITDYVSNHHGQLPTNTAGSGHELILCGSQCDELDSEKVTIAHYAANRVGFIGFDASRKVPEAETLYLILGAACMTDGKGISPEATNKSSTLALLFGQDAGDNAIEQRCIAY